MLNNSFIDSDAWDFMSDDDRMQFLREEGFDDWYNVDAYGSSFALFDNRYSWADDYVDKDVLEEIDERIHWNETHDEGLCDEISECIDRHIELYYYEDCDIRRYIMDQVYDEVYPLTFDEEGCYIEGYDSILEQAVIRTLAGENILKHQAEEN